MYYQQRRSGSGCGCLGCGLTGVLLAVGVIVVLALGLGFLGFVPGLSGLLGANKPRDLGVRFSEADLKSYKAKRMAGVELLPAGLPAVQSIKGAGAVRLDTSFTDRELTAVAAEREKQWAYWPISDWQIKIHDDGTIESSGLLRLDRAVGYGEAMGFPADVVRQAVQALRVAAGNPAFYLRGTGSVTDGQVSLHVLQVQIGRLPVPVSVVDDNLAVVTDAVEQIMERTGVQAESVSFSEGQMHFRGALPAERFYSPVP